jgi:hypothetical protein
VFSALRSVIPAKQESRKIEAGNLDARLRGHDGKNTPTSQLIRITVFLKGHFLDELYGMMELWNAGMLGMNL